MSLVALAALCLAGCGTIGTCVLDESGPYSGVRADAWIVAGGGIRGLGGWPTIPVALLDLPLSFLADTLLLPMTLPGSQSSKSPSPVRQSEGPLEGLSALSYRVLRDDERPTSTKPYLVGRVAPIDLDSRWPLLHLWGTLPDDLRARNTFQVETLLGVSFRRDREGRPQVYLLLVDVAQARVIHRVTHHGYLSSSEIVEFLRALPRR